MTNKHFFSAIVAAAALLAATGGYFVFTEATASPARPEPLTPGQYGSTVAAVTSDEQAAVLQDGVVTLAEYETAVQRVVACGAAAGLRGETIPGKGLRPSEARFTAPDSDGQPDAATVGRAQEAVAGCFREHLTDIQVAWALQGLSTPGATEKALRRLTECIHDTGAPLPDATLTLDSLNAQLAKTDARTDEDRAWRRAYFQCATVVEEEQGFKLP